MTATKFCVAEVPLWDDLVLYVDGNSKITAGNGTFEEPKPNAFSLPHISSCPGSTPVCRAACYVNGLEAEQRELYRLYQLNSMALHRVMVNLADAENSARMLGQWIAENCQGGFRWHVSGDVMNYEHARWISRVCDVASKVPFWIYTRSDPLVSGYLSAANLTVNLSVDRDNYDRMRRGNFPRRRLCYLTTDGTLPDDLPDDAVIFPDYALRGRSLDNTTMAPWWLSLSPERRRRVCPADFFGQSEGNRCGPCNKCLVKPGGTT
jgi:hypothetical protein